MSYGVKMGLAEKAVKPFLVCAWTETVVSVFPCRAKVISQGNLMKTTVIQSNISGLIRIVIGEHKSIYINTNNRCKQLKPLFSKSTIYLELGTIKTPSVGQSCPKGAKT